MLAVLLLVVAVLVVYCPLALLGGRATLRGADFENFHIHRLNYAREALFGPQPHLPAWFSRELLGAPFWSNVQSFPFLPTRLAILWLDPEAFYPVAANLGAILAAFFAYLYCRKIDFGLVSSAIGGWTFAASGFFASRVLAGHLPLLEIFCGLPLLLWLVESIGRAAPKGRGPAGLLVSLGIASGCLVLAGHPQLPAYAIGTAVVYALWRIRGVAGARCVLAMALGVGMSMFQWWPMLDLIGRSTRVLPLERAANDLSFPYWRLGAFLFPWKDGWPSAVVRSGMKPFSDTQVAIFWDTVCYVGWLPILAAFYLLVRLARKRSSVPSEVRFLLVAGALALALALPWVQELGSGVHLTILRSPARQIYVVTFALAVAFASAIEGHSRTRRPGRGWGGDLLLGLLVVIHAGDLTLHDRQFVQVVSRRDPNPALVETARKIVGDGRAAIDSLLPIPVNRAVDDVGFFDSILLSRPYRAVTAMAKLPSQTNIQQLDGALLPGQALAGLAVRFVLTRSPRSDLPLLQSSRGTFMYAVPESALRVAFFPEQFVNYADDEEILARFRDGNLDIRSGTILPIWARNAAEGRSEPLKPGRERPEVLSDREKSDRITARIRTNNPGCLRIIEAWDPGWRATLDGKPADVLIADAFAMAVRVPAGTHEVRLQFKTPGSGMGLAISISSLALLATLGALVHLRAREDGTELASR
jgi:hypothetical protein